MKQDKPVLSRRKAITGGAALIAAPAIIGTARANEKVTWKCQAHWPKASASFGDSLAVIAKELEENTKGRFKLQLFGAGEFAKGGEILNIVRRGVVEMGTIAPSYMLGDVPSAGLAYGVPGTFREPWEFQYYLKNMGFEAMFNEDLAKLGVVSRAEKCYPSGLVVSKPIESIEDFAKLKVRSSGTLLTYLEAAGAAPQYIAGPELYQSMASGIVDGAHWGAAQGAQSMSLWEVAKYQMHPALGMSMDTLIMNQESVDALPEDLRYEFFYLLEQRFWKRCAQYQYLEKVALSEGIAKQGVKVMQFPQAVQEKFAEASASILKGERAKGGNAEKGADMLTGLMKTLGYV